MYCNLSRTRSATSPIPISLILHAVYFWPNATKNKKNLPDKCLVTLVGRTIFSRFFFHSSNWAVPCHCAHAKWKQNCGRHNDGDTCVPVCVCFLLISVFRIFLRLPLFWHRRVYVSAHVSSTWTFADAQKTSFGIASAHEMRKAAFSTDIVRAGKLFFAETGSYVSAFFFTAKSHQSDHANGVERVNQRRSPLWPIRPIFIGDISVGFWQNSLFRPFRLFAVKKKTGKSCCHSSTDPRRVAKKSKAWAPSVSSVLSGVCVTTKWFRTHLGVVGSLR